MSKEAMKLALEALETAWTYDEDNADGYYFEAITALREALAKPDFWEGYVPEPVKPAQVSPLEFVTMTLEKEHLVGQPIIWAQWPNKENT